MHPRELASDEAVVTEHPRPGARHVDDLLMKKVVSAHEGSKP